MFLALKEIKKEKLRFVMIILVTTLISFLVYFLTGLAYGLASANKTSVEHWQAEGVVLSNTANGNINASVIEESVARELASKDSHLLTIYPTVVSVNQKEEQFNLVLMGTESNDELLLPKIIEGNKIAEEDEIILSKSFKEEVDVKLGDKIKVVSTTREFKVVGFSETSEYNTQSVGYVELNMASQAMMTYSPKDKKIDSLSSATPNMPKRVSAIVVNQTISKKKLKDNDLVYYSMKEFIKTIPGYQAQLLTFGLMIVSLILISAVIISIFMYILTMQKKSVFAILKIQGISGSYISGSVIYQTIVVSTLGSVLGILLTGITFYFMPSKVPVLMNWEFVGIISILFVVCSLLGSLFSARSILKIDPLDAL